MAQKSGISKTFARDFQNLKVGGQAFQFLFLSGGPDGSSLVLNQTYSLTVRISLL